MTQPIEKNGAGDGARTRDLRRDRPEGPLVVSTPCSENRAPECAGFSERAPYGFMRFYFKDEQHVGGVKPGDKPVGYRLDWYQPEVCEERLIALRKDAGSRVEHWAAAQKEAAAAKDFETARFCSAELKAAQKEVRLLNDLRDALCPPPPFTGHLPRKVWPLSDHEVCRLSQAIRDPSPSFRNG